LTTRPLPGTDDDDHHDHLSTVISNDNDPTTCIVDATPVTTMMTSTWLPPLLSGSVLLNDLTRRSRDAGD